MKLYEEFKEYENLWSLEEGHLPDGTYVSPERHDIPIENQCRILLPYQRDSIIFDLYNENEVDGILNKCAELIVKLGNRARPGAYPRRSADELDTIKEECREAYNKVVDQLKANAKMLAEDMNKFLEENDRFFATRKNCVRAEEKQQLATIMQMLRDELSHWSNDVFTRFEDGKFIFVAKLSPDYNTYKKATSVNV